MDETKERGPDPPGPCPGCGGKLNWGYNKFVWCLCGYKDTSREDPELNKIDYGLLGRIFD